MHVPQLYIHIDVHNSVPLNFCCFGFKIAWPSVNTGSVVWCRGLSLLRESCRLAQTTGPASSMGDPQSLLRILIKYYKKNNADLGIYISHRWWGEGPLWYHLLCCNLLFFFNIIRGGKQRGFPTDQLGWLNCIKPI